MSAAAVVMGAGAAINAYSALQAAETEAEAFEQQAYLKRLQAEETLKASEREAELTRKRGEEVKSAQAVAFGHSGVAVGEGSPLQIMANTVAEARSESAAIMEAGRYRAFTQQFEAANSEKLAGSTRKAGKLRAVGSILSAGGSYAAAKGAF